MSQSIDLSNIARAICNEKGYKYTKEAGRGAYKVTYQVQTANEEEFALKVYMPDRRNEREEREIEAMERCKHPNIAQLCFLDNYKLDGLLYLYSIEEYLGGGTLSERLKKGLLKKEIVLSLGEYLISAVAHIASHGLVHRDLKPDNILFRRNSDIPVIVDFGIVRDLNATSKTGTWALRGPGTPFYAAPEQLNNEKKLQDWRTDQFALGVLLSESAFGKHPYDINGIDYQTVDAVASRQSPSPEFKTNVQESGLIALEKMVDPYPVRRFRTPIDLTKAWAEQKDN